MLLGEIQLLCPSFLRQKTILNSQQLHNLGLIETDYRLAVDDRYRRALKAEIDQFFQRCLVGADVFFHKLNALLR